MFHYTVETDGTVEEAIDALEQRLQADQFGVLWRFNIQDKLQEKGFAFESKYIVLEVCNPAEANRVLSETPMAGYFLPCKIVVYEAEGKVKVGMLKPSALMDVMQNDSLRRIASDVEERLIQSIDGVRKVQA
ncbi:DUF302 domain-containing protein [Paenibacillus antri]|uniref:DUF302 domain-containing protein n=1 Tax=Paenibacillus antri TaxID=2582848 RepID=A0A5R9GHC1_9BACL|nr:DUF302 domain-containing protein [Paenibacillus antri]TLS52818.1 DUF302 domain-containing protein [Paenibacillus antri]